MKSARTAKMRLKFTISFAVFHKFIEDTAKKLLNQMKIPEIFVKGLPNGYKSVIICNSFEIGHYRT